MLASLLRAVSGIYPLILFYANWDGVHKKHLVQKNPPLPSRASITSQPRAHMDNITFSEHCLVGDLQGE